MEKEVIIINRSFLRVLLAGFAVIIALSLTACGFTDKDGDTKAAYDIWLDEGNNGSENDFLSWLKMNAAKDVDNGDETPEEDDIDSIAYDIWISEGNDGSKTQFLNWLKVNASKSENSTDNNSSNNDDEDNTPTQVIIKDKTAYNAWLSQGNIGSEADFLEWIKKMSEDDSYPEEKPTIFDGVKFESITVAYDGLPHEIKAVGIPEGTEVEYSNNIAVDYGTYRAFVRLYKEGVGEKLLSATLTIGKKNITDVTFEDSTVQYNGEVQNIFVTNLPDGVEVSYTMNGQPFEGAEDVGVYNIEAVLTGDNYDSLTLTAVLEITKADITDVTLENVTVTYDGSEKNVSVAGTVPSGVSVTYLYDSNPITGFSNVGVYEITAVLSGDNFNTKTIEATLEITKAEITGVRFDNAEFFEDGENKSIFISGTEPDGVTVEYTLNGDEFNGVNAVGSYEITAVLTGDNYNTLTLTATLTIKKNKITGVTFSGLTVKYDGTEKNIQVEGDLPDGVSVTYNLRMGSTPFSGATEIGTYDVLAKLTGAYYEPLTLNAVLTITPDLLDTVTGLALAPDGTSVNLTWNAVDNAGSYDISIYDVDKELIETVNVPRLQLSYDIRLKMINDAGSYIYFSGDYYLEITALPKTGEEQYAASLPSEAILYEHDGVLHTPEDVRIEDGSLKWSAVQKAGVYRVHVTAVDIEGNETNEGSEYYAAKDGTEISLETLKTDFELEPGNYKCRVSAVPVEAGTENSSNPMVIPNRASPYSAYTEIVNIE